MTPARCRRRSHLQEQALPALVLQVETDRPEPIQRCCHRPEPRPPLPRRAPRLNDIRAHSLLLLLYHTSRGTPDRQLSPTAMSDLNHSVGDPHQHSPPNGHRRRRLLRSPIPGMQTLRLPSRNRRSNMETCLSSLCVRFRRYALQLGLHNNRRCSPNIHRRPRRRL